MDRVLWDDGAEAIAYVVGADKGLKILHVRTTGSALRGPLEHLIADSEELDRSQARFGMYGLLGGLFRSRQGRLGFSSSGERRRYSCS